jgi:hypothetical protein
MGAVNVVFNHPREVSAALNYIAPPVGRPYRYNFDPPPGVAYTDACYQPHPVVIQNLRPTAATFSLDVQGFELHTQPSVVTDFYDEDELTQTYYPETEAMLKALTGAHSALVFDHTVRRRADAEYSKKPGLPREPVPRVHNDYTFKSGPQRVRDLVPEHAEELLQRRFSIINIWRPIRGPLQDTPLAVCDARSVQPDDLVPLDLIYRDRTGEIYMVRYSGRHRWYYAPDMSSDEILLLKTFDSAEDGRARFAVHGAFEDPNTPANRLPRESIELRALLFHA